MEGSLRFTRMTGELTADMGESWLLPRLEGTGNATEVKKFIVV